MSAQISRSDTRSSSLNASSMPDMRPRNSQHLHCSLASSVARRALGVVITAGAAGLSASEANASLIFSPNDPYFNQPGQPTSFSQWYLDKTGTGAQVDINVRGAWNQGFTGQGVTIGLIDTGFQYTHPDLQQNYKAADSYDFYQGDSDPLQTVGAHGTAVAGLTSGRGGNGIGITGVAPYSQFAGIRAQTSGLLFSNTVGVQGIASALSYHSTGSSPAIHIKNLSSGEIGGYGSLMYPVVNELDLAVKQSTAAGTVHVTIAGNYRSESGTINGYEGDSNKKYIAHLPEVITVAALNSQGNVTNYSGWGSNVAVAAPSGALGQPGVLTTDTLGTNGNNPGTGDSFSDRDYTSIFSGTSASAPIVSGVLALAKEAHDSVHGNNLVGGDNARFYKHTLIDPLKAKGNSFSNSVGWGLVDASATVEAAMNHVGVTPLVTHSSGLVSAGNAIIPIGDAIGISKEVSINGHEPLEEVLVRLVINSDPQYIGECYGSIQGTITSPSGTISLFSTANPLAEHIYDYATAKPVSFDWIFTDLRFWSEDPHGTWLVNLSHPYGSNGVYDQEYKWASVEITTRSGELVSVPEPGALAAVGVFGGAMLLRRRRKN